MRRSMGLITAALALLAGAADSYAQTYYFGLRGSYETPHDADLTAGGVAGQEAAFAPSPAAAGAFGFEWIDGWRFEGELSWRRSDFTEIDGVAVAGGQAETYAAMVNVYYGLRRDATVNPYLGAGMGAARLAVSDLAIGLATVDDFGVAYAWQGMAGVDFALSQSSRLSLEYRYLAVDEVKLTDSLGAAFNMNYRSSSALLGLRIGF